MPFAVRRTLMRLAVWLPFAVLLAVDAAVATPLSLGLLYFGPLIVSALFLPRAETLGLAVLCAVGRALFGPADDPLGISDVTYHLPAEFESATDAFISLFAYSTVAMVVATVGKLRREVEALGHEAQTDALTGLANRRAFDQTLSRHAGRQVAILAVDLDHFKRVNDEHGHGAGDQVLRELADRLGACVRGGDLVARTGGEEFVVLLPNGKDTAGAMVARRIVNTVRARPFDIRGITLPITVSVGHAVGPAGPELLRRADEALYAAKAAGRDRAVAASSGPANPAAA